MSLVENGNTVMPVVPMYGNYGCNGNNDGVGDGWWIILLLLAMNGWGNGNGMFGNGNGGNAIWPYFTAQNTDAGVQRGFDTAALTGQLSGIQSSISDGFAGVEVSACNKAMDQMKATYDSQIASMNQRFTDTLATNNAINNVASELQNCCCENRAGLADLKYTVATENCADRTALNEGVRDIIANQTAGIQSILDKLCQQELDAERRENNNLRQQLYMKDLAASQLAQTIELRNGQNTAVDNLYTRLATCPVGTMPVYGSQPIFTCNNNGCGCGSF